MTNKPDWNRFAMWIIFNVLFALVPLVTVWFFRHLFNKDALETNNDYPEIMFVAIMICSTALGDIIGRRSKEKWDLIFNLFVGVLLLGVLTSAIIYGGLRLANVMNPTIVLPPQALNYAILLTTCLGLAGITSEVLVTYSDVSSLEAITEENHE